jgi:type VI secretion system secreted protein Hcp
MAFDSFLKIDGIPGESTDDGHKDWIELVSFSHNMEQPVSGTASSVGGATSERINHGFFDVVHLYDKASPKIADACCTGRHIKEITIDVCRAGDGKQKYAQIKLEQAVICKVSLIGGSLEDFPSEALSFSYGKITWKYFQQDRASGKEIGQVAAGWDLTTNKTYA